MSVYVNNKVTPTKVKMKENQVTWLVHMQQRPMIAPIIAPIKRSDRIVDTVVSRD